MRKLTFKGYLYKYVKTLSLSGTNDIKRLAGEVPKNYRLAEPLVLYAMSVSKRNHLNMVATDPHLQKLIQCFPNQMSWDEVLSALESNDESYPHEFRKVYNSYVTHRDRQIANSHTKELMFKRTRQLQQEKGVTAYRVYTDLKLNHGNVNAYLKNGDVSKVGVEVAERVLEYLKSV